jgi:DnaK suppressor protein
MLKNKSFLKKIKQMLLDQKAELAKKYSSLNEEIDVGSDDVDQIQAAIITNAISSLAIHDRRKLARIEEALNKIAEGTFGICNECGEDIGEKRIMFNPSFLNCISCAEELEMARKRSVR